MRKRFGMAEEVIKIIILSILIASSGAETAPEITIVSPGFFALEASLSYTGPTIETGVQHLNKIYPNCNWTVNYVFDDKATTYLACCKMFKTYCLDGTTHSNGRVTSAL
jgi:hypothetical protein